MQTELRTKINKKSETAAKNHKKIPFAQLLHNLLAYFYSFVVTLQRTYQS